MRNSYENVFHSGVFSIVPLYKHLWGTPCCSPPDKPGAQIVRNQKEYIFIGKICALCFRLSKDVFSTWKYFLYFYKQDMLFFMNILDNVGT